MKTRKSTTAPRDPVNPALFGRDHWSLLGYVETLCVDAPNGRAGKFVFFDHARMRCDTDLHPALWGHVYFDFALKGKYPTRLAGGVLLEDHDDWSAVDDLEAAALVETGGTGIHPSVKLTPLGQQVSAKLREHKGNGGNFSEFRWDPATGAYAIKPKGS